MGWLFRFLFKYPAYVFGQGDFQFAASRSMAIGLVALALIAAASLFTLRSIRNEGASRSERAVIVGLRLALLALLTFCLLRPSIILKAAVPQQNFLGILIDDSKSMTIADRDGQSRTAFVQEQFGTPESPLLKTLAQKFV